MKVLVSTVASGVVVLTAFCALAESSRSLGDLSGPWELMVDDHLVESRQNLVRRYHAFQKYPGNPVLKPDRPWEGQVAYLFGSVLPAENGEGYRMWYHTANPEAPPEEQYRNLYAESPDGIVWHKPDPLGSGAAVTEAAYATLQYLPGNGRADARRAHLRLQPPGR